jgi:hypothetical protein
MTTHLLFISYAEKDRQYHDRLVEWAKQGLLGTDRAVSVPSGDVARPAHRGLHGHIGVHLLTANAMILLVGNDTHTCEWINNELNHVLTQRKKLVVVRLPGTNGPLPRVAVGQRTVPFTPAAIKSALDG